MILQMYDSYFYSFLRSLRFPHNLLDGKEKYDTKVDSRDDVEMTCLNLLKYGKILKNNFVLLTFKRYGLGGFGKEKDRYELKKKECSYLANKYKGLLRIVDKPEERKVDVKFNMFNGKAISKWRNSMAKPQQMLL